MSVAVLKKFAFALLTEFLKMLDLLYIYYEGMKMKFIGSQKERKKND